MFEEKIIIFSVDLEAKLDNLMIIMLIICIVIHICNTATYRMLFVLCLIFSVGFSVIFTTGTGLYVLFHVI